MVKVNGVEQKSSRQKLVLVTADSTTATSCFLCSAAGILRFDARPTKFLKKKKDLVIKHLARQPETDYWHSHAASEHGQTHETSRQNVTFEWFLCTLCAPWQHRDVCDSHALILLIAKLMDLLVFCTQGTALMRTALLAGWNALCCPTQPERFHKKCIKGDTTIFF